MNSLQFDMLYQKAVNAGLEAVKKCTPVPMIVGTPKDGLFGNEIDRDKKVYYVPDGVCGFAWVKVRPGNAPFAKWLKKMGIVRGAAYGGGVDIWIGEFGQSMEKKEAYARGMAEVLREAGINAYVGSRMD